MNYGLLRSILHNIPTDRGLPGSVDSPEKLGDFLLDIADEMRDLRTSAQRGRLADMLQQTIEAQDFEIDRLRREVEGLRAENGKLRIEVRFGGKSLDQIADTIWSDHGGESMIPAIREFRCATGSGLADSLAAIKAARGRAGGEAA